ncbi:MAG: hypothetical protein QOC78_3623 [Solirubrobacteraceae bacterium]|jgi:ferritin-like metal-binding protein YciE/uncharacterized protein (DUF433 family)|nr:hypothetical protein [Solirubrobacteraceae bacterium]
MSTSDQKIRQYVNEAHATEMALVRVLQSQIAMTPRGSYREALERHLEETRDHARRLRERLDALGHRGDPLSAAVGLVETVMGQAIAIGKAPLDLLRGSGGEEKVLKNAKDTCATEALEIATYLALEHLARSLGDDETARLAASIRSDEERMLERVLKEIPALTEAVVRADVHGEPSYDLTTTGAADAVRESGRAAAEGARKATTRTRRAPARRARRAPASPASPASPADLPITRYDELTAEEIGTRLPELSQADLAAVAAYERRNQKRTTILTRIETLRAEEPWAGYDELTAEEIVAVLAEGDDDRARQVVVYERTHKQRVGVLRAAEREAASA